MPKSPKKQAAEPGPGYYLVIALRSAAWAAPKAAAGFPVDQPSAWAAGDGPGCSRLTSLCPQLLGTTSFPRTHMHLPQRHYLPRGAPGCCETIQILGDGAQGAVSAQGWAPRARAKAVGRGHRGAARQRTRSHNHVAVGHMTGGPLRVHTGGTDRRTGVPFAPGTLTSAPQAPGSSLSPSRGGCSSEIPSLLSCCQADEPWWGQGQGQPP